MQPDISSLRKNYEKFSDEKLIRLATEDADGLRPEALELLKEIIKERKISDDVVKGIEVQFQEIDTLKLVEYSELLRNLPCPICKSNIEKLNATMTGTVVSYLVMTNYEKEFKIACPTCLDKLNNDAMVKTVFFGWWGVPWGIIQTLRALILNSRMKRNNRSIDANDLFKSFILERVGRLKLIEIIIQN